MVPAVLVAALVPLGSSSPTATAILVVSILSLCAGVALRGAARGELGRFLDQSAAKLKTGMLLAFPLIVLLQYVLKLLAGVPGGPAAELLYSLAWLSTLVFFFLLCRAACHDQNSLRFISASLFLLAGAEAAYGLLNLLSGNEHLLFYKRWAYPDSATGTLVSRNHFAFLMEMLLPLAFAATISDAGPFGRGDLRPAEAGARRVVVSACTVLCALALFFSGSRMGISSFMLSLLLVNAMDYWVRPPRQNSNGAARLMIAIVAPAVLAIAAFIGLDPLFERFLRIPRHFEAGRLPVWQATIAMITDAPLWGHGWGSFGELIKAYRPAPTGLSYAHAHNEYLQIAAESGIAGLAVTLWMLYAFVAALGRSLRRNLSDSQRYMITAYAVAICSVLIHSAADFGLRVPGVALCFVAVLALFTRLIEDPWLVDGIATSNAAGNRAGKDTPE